MFAEAQSGRYLQLDYLLLVPLLVGEVKRILLVEAREIV